LDRDQKANGFAPFAFYLPLFFSGIAPKLKSVLASASNLKSSRSYNRAASLIAGGPKNVNIIRSCEIVQLPSARVTVLAITLGISSAEAFAVGRIAISKMTGIIRVE